MTLEFLLTAFIVVLLPGTGVIYTLAIGLGHGMRAATIAAFGCTLGIVWHVAASVAGVAALLHTSALLFQILKYLGVAYLLYMAWSILRDDSTLDVEADKTPVSSIRIIRDGILLNLFNPKLTLFFFAFLPQFVAEDASNPALSMLGLAGTFMAMTFVVFVAYGAMASSARNFVIARPAVITWLKRSLAGAFGLLGLRLAFAER
jgi:threonine/homoserine/homoserine lactone efflux protein